MNLAELGSILKCWVLTAASMKITAIIMAPSETSVYFHETTRRFIQQGCDLRGTSVFNRSYIQAHVPLNADKFNLQSKQ
jgi:hypothetical protein